MTSFQLVEPFQFSQIYDDCGHAVTHPVHTLAGTNRFRTGQALSVAFSRGLPLGTVPKRYNRDLSLSFYEILLFYICSGLLSI